MAHRGRRIRASAANLNFRSSIIFVFVLLLRILPDLCQPAAAYDFPFDPAGCKLDPQGRFFIALNRHVLAMPWANRDNWVYDPLRPGDLELQPPDPNDPVGCFGNPLQSGSHAFAYRYHRLMQGRRAPPPERAPAPDMLTLYALRDQKEDTWLGAYHELDVSERSCREADVLENLSNGLLACRIKPRNPPNEPQVEWPASYRAKPEIYSTPLGKPFVVNCGSFLFSNSMDSCDVAYTMKLGLGLSYHFQPYLGATAIPIDQIVDFDKSLRAEIETFLVKDYPWPDQGPAGGQIVGKKP